MVYIFKNIGDALQTINKIEKGCWVHVVSPNNDELNELSQKIQAPIEFFTDPLDIDERARIEIEDTYMLIVLRIPYVNKNGENIPFITLPLGIIVTSDFVVSICSIETEIISDFINGKIRRFLTENKERFIFQILFKTALLFLKYLREINAKTAIIERELHESMKNHELIGLLDLEKSLVYFTTSLKSNEIMMGRLVGSKLLKSSPDDIDLLDDAIVETKQALEMANVYSNILSGMMDAFASIISNNLNVVMKFLTSITIILAIPVLVASVYGMNVRLPFENSPHAFLITIGISFLFSAMGILIFIRRKFF
jgi:magnesium transporter